MPHISLIRIAFVAILVVLLLLLIRLHGAAGQASAQELVGNAASGGRLAEAWCNECHATGSKPAQRAGIGPDFAAIASLPSTTAASLTVILRTSHREKLMPNFVIAQHDADDIVAYILSLKRR
jgi:mono/diheme cytochrome c family protein